MKNMKLFVIPVVVAMFVLAAFAAVTNVAEAHTRTVKIRVDENGFSPSTIEVEAGHKLNLVFTRAGANNCGGTVVLPGYKIRRNLPVGKDVIVSITPRQAGTIRISCGMGMYKGSVVVTD
jgi:plastocyanin domain-containing protein